MEIMDPLPRKLFNAQRNQNFARNSNAFTDSLKPSENLCLESKPASFTFLDA